MHERTQRLRKRMRDHLGDKLDGFDAIATELGERDFPALGNGDRAPDFTLPDARGGEVTLSELPATVVLVFYRGAWCPYCNLQLRAYQEALAELETAGATLVAISPQTPDRSGSTEVLDFAVLSDVGGAVATSYGLTFTLDEAARDLHRGVGIDLAEWNGDDSWQLPAAATFVVDSGTIAYASISGDYRWRSGPEEVLELVRAREAA